MPTLNPQFRGMLTMALNSHWVTQQSGMAGVGAQKPLAFPAELFDTD